MYASKYIFLSSSAFTSDIYVNNQPFDFINNILCPLNLQPCKWEVALTEICWNPIKKEFSEDLYVMSDIVERSIQVGELFPEILRILRKPTLFYQPYYVPVSQHYIDSIRIYVKTESGEKPIEESIQNLRCTLHFREKRN